MTTVARPTPEENSPAACAALSERERTLQRFAEIVRLGRRVLRTGSSQSDFAKRIGVSLPTLRRMERGEPGISLDFWMRAWQALDMMRSLTAAIAPPDTMAIASAAAVASRAAGRTRRGDDAAPERSLQFPSPRARFRAFG